MNKIILLVEDNDDDAQLTLRALKKVGILNEVVLARDGFEALDYLFATGVHAERPLHALPQIVLLDLNLPSLSGLDVLKRIRDNPVTGLLPVVMLTSSKEEDDVMRSYRFGANSYVRKPVDFAEFVNVARSIGMYWLLLNEVPPVTAGLP